MAALGDATPLLLRQWQVLSGQLGGNDEPHWGLEMTSQVALWKIGGGGALLPTPLKAISLELIRGVAFVAIKVSVLVDLFPSLDGYWGGAGIDFWLVFEEVGGGWAVG